MYVQEKGKIRNQLEHLWQKAKKPLIGLLFAASAIAAADGIYSVYTTDQLISKKTQFDRMAPTSLGEPPALFFLEKETNSERIICTMYSNAAPLDYKDSLLPDPNLMTIACSTNGTNFVVVKTFEGQGPDGNKAVFEQVLATAKAK